ncbi:MAG: hypothetical protein IPP96_08360 [Chitinophagaceae bacterium]|nr:hypothetical protein [Chitinophagaceae bacterium]
MKKYLLILTLVLGAFSFVKAQDQQGDEQNNQKKIKALYVAYVSEQLQLTPDEAQKFWPVHTQFENDIKAVNKELPELQKQQAYLDVKKRYQENFSRIIGTNRCERFFRMDGEFKRKLLDQYRQRNNQRPRLRRVQ